MDAVLDAIDACLAELHGAAADLEPTRFRAEALGMLRARVPFEGAWWQVGTPSADATPRDLVRIGTAADRPLPAPDAQRETGRVLRYREREGGGRPVATLVFERASAPFDANERRLLGLLATQACALWHGAARAWLLRHLCSGREAAALADRDGEVHTAHGRFYAAVRASWPEWNGGPLPLPLRTAPAGGGLLVARGQHWSIRTCGGSLLVAASPLGALATLTERERAVVAAVLEAGSQRVAAERLRISAHTVRNTLARVYRKLGIRGRVQLATRFPPALAVVANCGSLAT